MLYFKMFLLKLYTPAIDGYFPGYLDRRAEMSVRVQKGRFIVETLLHQNLGPKVLLETL